MTTSEDLDNEMRQFAADARKLAARFPFDRRADLLRELAKAVRDAAKLDPPVGEVPGGREWELDGLAPICDAAENYYNTALEARYNTALETKNS